MNFNKILQGRTSIRKYSTKKPDMELVLDVIEAANLAPSPGNLPIAKFIIVEDHETIDEIAEACCQPFLRQARVLVVVCSDSTNIKRMYDVRADKYVKHQVGAAVENFLLKITEMGLASCWVGAFSDETIKNILKIPEDIEVEVVLPVAYPDKNSNIKQKSKLALESRVYFEKWKNKLQKPEVKIRMG